MVDPFAGVTAAVDITDFLAALDGRPFFLSLLYAVDARGQPCAAAAAADSGRARRGIRLVQPVVHAHEARRRVCLQPDRGRAHLRRLHRRGAAAADALARPQDAHQGRRPLGNFFVSCLPWLDYLQVKHPVVSADDSNPRISWGRYTERGGRVTLPVSIFVNHALADGLHIAQFYSCLDKELRELVKLLRSQEK